MASPVKLNGRVDIVVPARVHTPSSCPMSHQGRPALDEAPARTRARSAQTPSASRRRSTRADGPANTQKKAGHVAAQRVHVHVAARRRRCPTCCADLSAAAAAAAGAMPNLEMRRGWWLGVAWLGLSEAGCASPTALLLGWMHDRFNSPMEGMFVDNAWLRCGL